MYYCQYRKTFWFKLWVNDDYKVPFQNWTIDLIMLTYKKCYWILIFVCACQKNFYVSSSLTAINRRGQWRSRGGEVRNWAVVSWHVMSNGRVKWWWWKLGNDRWKIKYHFLIRGCLARLTSFYLILINRLRIK